MTRKKRKYIPLKVRLAVALRQLAEAKGCDPKALRLDHDPALELRDWNARKTDTVPPANSMLHLLYRVDEDHKTKTYGPGGEKRITTRGGDNHTAKRIERLAQKNRDFQKLAGMGVMDRRQERERKTSKWPKRKFRGN